MFVLNQENTSTGAPMVQEKEVEVGDDATSIIVIKVQDLRVTIVQELSPLYKLKAMLLDMAEGETLKEQLINGVCVCVVQKNM